MKPRDVEPDEIDPAVIEQAKAEHGEITQLMVGQHPILVRCPTPEELDMFLDTVKEDTASGPALVLVTSCIVHPTAREFAQIRRERPGCVVTILKQLRRIAGLEEDLKAKKV